MPRGHHEQKYCSDTDKEYTRIIFIFLANVRSAPTGAIGWVLK